MMGYLGPSDINCFVYFFYCVLCKLCKGSLGPSAWETPTSLSRLHLIIAAGRLLGSEEHLYTKKVPTCSSHPTLGEGSQNLETAAQGIFLQTTAKPPPWPSSLGCCWTVKPEGQMEERLIPFKASIPVLGDDSHVNMIIHDQSVDEWGLIPYWSGIKQKRKEKSIGPDGKSIWLPGILWL